MADVSLFPPTSILSNHSHQIYHHPLPLIINPVTLPFTPLMQSQSGFMSGDRSGSPARAATTTFLRSPFPSSLPPSRRHPIPSPLGYVPQPPSNGSSPISVLPDEVLLCIFAQLQLEDLLRLRRTCARFTPLAIHPSLHRSLALFSLPPSSLPRLLTHHILPSVHHLHLHLFPLPTPSPTSASYRLDAQSDQPASRISTLLSLIPADQLISLSLPFSAPFLPSADLGEVLSRIGGRLEKLDLRGSAVEGLECLGWMNTVGKRNRYGGLREIDLGFTSISALPLPSTDEDASEPSETCWSSLRKLSLASCSTLSADTIAAFLAVLPANIESLDLSRLDQVSYAALRDMRVIVDIPSSGEATATQLKEIKLVGIDHLTRSNIRSLKNHWQSQRLSLLPQTPPSFSWSTLISATPHQRRVWGEPRTPEPLPIPPTSLPRLIPRSSLAPPASSLESLSLSGSWSSGSRGTPDLISPSSSSSATSNSYPSSQSSFSRASAISTHSALWSALSRDEEQGITASPGVWRSKLPENPYLPSRSDPKGRSASSSSSTSAFGRQWAWRGIEDEPNVSDADYIPRQASVEPCTLAEGKMVSINVTHSAILESEDEEGYRMFIGEVAGADTTLPAGTGSGLGLGIGMGAGLFGGMGGWGGSGVAGYQREGEQYLAGLAGV